MAKQSIYHNLTSSCKIILKFICKIIQSRTANAPRQTLLQGWLLCIACYLGILRNDGVIFFIFQTSTINTTSFSMVFIWLYFG